MCRAPWEKGRGKDVEARVCSPSKSKGVNAIWGEGASNLSVADFTGIAKELNFIPGAVGSHYRLLAGGDHNPNIRFLKKSIWLLCAWWGKEGGLERRDLLQVNCQCLEGMWEWPGHAL